MFIDTLNYISMGVSDLGKILNIPKLDKPKALGRLPRNKEEKDEIVTYNIRDAEISQRFIQFFFDGITAMGGSPKITVASTAMALFKNKYLKDTYWTHDQEILVEQFQGYYGGRTEAFERGRVEEYNYYDFNSLYPSVMRDNVYPNPNTFRVCHKNTEHYIRKYEGMSDVTVVAPYMKYPILPFKAKSKKLVFPTGEFRGWHCHNELRYALDNGYKILEVHRTHYYKEVCEPFRDYVNDLYKLRMEWKKEKSAKEKLAKLMLNSLYGKFGQKFFGKDEIRPFDLTIEELNKLDNFERVGEFIRIKKGIEPPASFCFPIWSAYVTAYGRIKLHKEIVKCKPVYVDTDSLITEKERPTSNLLGHLKLEYVVKEAVIVKPKMYAVLTGEDKEIVRIKGVAKKMSYKEFIRFVDNPVVQYKKFTKFKEAIRRGLIPNELIEIEKYLTLIDDKRVWDCEFDKKILAGSNPVSMSCGLTTHERDKIREKVEEFARNKDKKMLDEFLKSDLFDSHSVGSDITAEEFMENEMFFARMED